jgi:uncharacterized protein YfaS (alpha-2-macroglobulin family)
MVMLDAAEAAGNVKVDTLVLHKLAEYLTSKLHVDTTTEFTPLGYWWADRRELQLREKVAAADFLSRYGRPDVAAENELVRTTAQLTMEDRSRLAEVLARRQQTAAARRLMEPTWALIRVEGNRAVLPDSTRPWFYFESRVRPLARVMTATLAIEPEHALVGPMAETLAQQNRADSWQWNTQDYASTVDALAALDRHRRAQGDRSVRVRAGDRVLMQGGAAAQSAMRDSSVALSGLVARGTGRQTLKLLLDAAPGAAAGAVYYYLSVTEIPAAPPVTPEDRGIQVERWYERLDGGAPIISATEGDLVRVRLRITVPAMRYFVVLDDALPAGLEAVDLSLRTASSMAGPGANTRDDQEDSEPTWYGHWDSGWWSPFDHQELRDDRVMYSGTVVWRGSYTATYIARATTPGTFIRPPAHAEEMYNPAVNGRSDGGTFVVTARP